jgi:hypothetical protein
VLGRLGTSANRPHPPPAPSSGGGRISRLPGAGRPWARECFRVVLRGADTTRTLSLPVVKERKDATFVSAGWPLELLV